MRAWAGGNTEKGWTQTVHEEWINSLRAPLYYLKTVDLEQYVHMSPFLSAAQIPRNHRANVFLTDKEVHYLCDMTWKTASVA